MPGSLPAQPGVGAVARRRTLEPCSRGVLTRIGTAIAPSAVIIAPGEPRTHYRAADARARAVEDRTTIGPDERQGRQLLDLLEHCITALADPSEEDRATPERARLPQGAMAIARVSVANSRSRCRCSTAHASSTVRCPMTTLVPRP